MKIEGSHTRRLYEKVEGGICYEYSDRRLRIDRGDQIGGTLTASDRRLQI